jgi:iron-sulfur cluster repair protein YtfE (RIC family)
MPVQIGTKAHPFTDPTGLLSDCHRRIEMFLDTLDSVARVIGQSPTDEVQQALKSALRYFSQAAPKHTADEEQSLFPRLRQTANAEIASALSRLDELEGDHRRADPLHAEVEHLGVKYLAEGRLSVGEVTRFRDLVRELKGLYEQHIRIEDDLIFPLAARHLSERHKRAISDEMAGRRKVKLMSQSV